MERRTDENGHAIALHSVSHSHNLHTALSQSAEQVHYQ
jgi:hypothetical protein